MKQKLKWFEKYTAVVRAKEVNCSKLNEGKKMKESKEQRRSRADINSAWRVDRFAWLD